MSHIDRIGNAPSPQFHPVSHFDLPGDVVHDKALSVAEKRAILSPGLPIFMRWNQIRRCARSPELRTPCAWMISSPLYSRSTQMTIPRPAAVRSCRFHGRRGQQTSSRANGSVGRRDGLLQRGADRHRGDQPLQLGNAGSAIGAGLQPRADLGRSVRTSCNRVADRRAADAKAGADHRACADDALAGAARQQQAAFVVGERPRPRTGASPRPSRPHHARARRTGRPRYDPH